MTRTMAAKLGLLLLIALLVAGCSTRVERVAPDEQRDLSGRWNDTDSRLVAEEMVADVLSRAWLRNHVNAQVRQPAVIVGEIRNLSHEHINMRTFVTDIQRALINSGKVEFVAARDERDELRDERLDQDLHAREDTRKAMGRELGADYMLQGNINTILDVEGRQQVRYYQVDLTLTSLTDNRIVWIGQKKIKKFVTRPRLRS